MSLIPAEQPSPAPRRVGRPLLAWLVILGVVGFVLGRNQRSAAEASQESDSLTQEMQARYLVGLSRLTGSASKAAYDQARVLNRGPYGERLRFVTVAGELAGREEAREQLRELDAAVARGAIDPPSPQQRELADTLQRLYREQEGGLAKPLTADESQELRERLGWFGDLALAPTDEEAKARALAPARRTAVGLIGWVGVMLLLGLAGLILGVLLLIFALLGRLQRGLECGSPYGGVYAETFALYLLLFLGGAFALGRLPVGPDYRMALSGVAALGGLAALAWPVLRGVPWRQVREEIGWTWGRRPALEPVVGVGCYLTALPLLLLGLLTYLLLNFILRHLGVPVSEPSHPAAEWVVRSGWGVRVQVLIDACLVAPLVEETMFRGVLYRHLREASCRVRRVGSVLFSAAVSSLVFAIIHPQGVVFVPVLAGLAVAFALAREWRGTLIPPMVAHGLNNGMTMLLLLVIAG
jgi:membrane protease YdiL (CAAX protease family)